MIDIDTSESELSYALVDTPIDLWKRLKADTAIARYARNAEVDVLIAAIIDSLVREPTTLREAVMPFVLISVLSMKNDGNALKSIGSLDMEEHKNLREYYDIVKSSTIPNFITSTNLASPRIADRIIGPSQFKSTFIITR